MSTALMVFLTGLSGFALETSAHADEGCLGEAPLSTVTISSVAVANSPVPITSWHLPVSASQAPKTSAAQVRVDLIEAEPGVWQFQFGFSFVDPNTPWGIPYSFQKLHLSWDVAGQPHGIWVDWSDQCSNVGRSLYPGQAWTAVEKVNEGDLNAVLGRFQIELYGSRN